MWFSFPSKERLCIFLCQIASALHVVSLPVHEVLSRQPILCVFIAMGTRLVSSRHQAAEGTDASRLVRNPQVPHGPWSRENVFMCKNGVYQTGQGRCFCILLVVLKVLCTSMAFDKWGLGLYLGPFLPSLPSCL